MKIDLRRTFEVQFTIIKLLRHYRHTQRAYSHVFVLPTVTALTLRDQGSSAYVNGPQLVDEVCRLLDRQMTHHGTRTEKMDRIKRQI